MELSQEVVDQLATEFCNIRKKAKRARSSQIKIKYREFQNYCVKQLFFLVEARTYKYKQFPNFEDLQQEGLEALLLALKTYDASKGSFSWWADKYINTKVSRAANSHSTIKIPIKKARKLKPFKIKRIPNILDSGLDPEETLESKEIKEEMQQALTHLSIEEQALIKIVFGFNRIKNNSIGDAAEYLKISRNQSLKILEEAKSKLRDLFEKSRL